jgi:release factor glutamine methyltransferase
MVERRVHGEPIEYVLGWAEFCGLRIVVAPGVFVPRRRTEILVREAIALAGSDHFPTIVDLCCGSGAIGVAIAAQLNRGGLRNVALHAVDVDPAAAHCARRNAARVGGHVYDGDLYEPLPADLRGRVNVLVANAPYVPSEAVALLPPEARLHEARIALDGGADGLDILRRVTAGTLEWLAPGGHLLVETSERQAPAMADTMTHGGLIARVVHDEERGATVVIGGRPTSDRR